MHPRTEEVLTYLNQTGDDLRAAVDSVPPDLREQQPAADQWSAAQVVDHLAKAHTLVAGLVEKAISDAKAAGLEPETATSSVLHTIPSERILDRSRKVTAPERIVPRNQVDLKTAWNEFDESREKLHAAFVSGDGLALEQVIQTHPVLGSINMYQWVLFNGSHEARHTLQVREIAAAFNSRSEAATSAGES